jgi:hypothetical protein
MSGHIDLKKRLIRIDSKLNGDEYWCTLIHEYLHAILNEGSLSQTMSEDYEEVLVDLIGKCISQNFDIKHKK